MFSFILICVVSHFALLLFLLCLKITMLVVIASLLLVFVAAQSNPSDLVCDNVAVRPSLWSSKFPTNVAFNGFFRADGNIQFFAPTGQALFAIPLDGSLWHQYFNVNGLLVGDLFLSGAALGYPGVLVLSSRQVSNPMFSSDSVCQKFLAPSPSNLITSYSELAAHGIGYMESKYYSLDTATFRQVFSNEIFSFDSEMKTAFSQTNTYVLGNGTANHYIFQSVNFRYTPITETVANTLGYNSGNVANVTTTRGFHCGRGAVPVTILSDAQRTQLGL